MEYLTGRVINELREQAGSAVTVSLGGDKALIIQRGELREELEGRREAAPVFLGFLNPHKNVPLLIFLCVLLSKTCHFETSSI